MLSYLLHSGKNQKFPYYLRCALRTWLLPDALFRARRGALLRSIEARPDRDYIHSRAAYYCRIPGPAPLAEDRGTVGEFSLRGGHGSVYFFDTHEYLRYFPTALRWNYRFGDVNTPLPFPSICKSRPVGEAGRNNVLLNLDKVRHFIFLHDRKPFREKMPRAIFRGEIDGKERRKRFCQMWYGSDICDVGEIAGRHVVCPQWVRPKMTLYEHLDYQFVICLEGNDVASNLKWVMSSNSLAVMPRPTRETWYMEGRLIPDYHYVEIRPDFSDLAERIRYFSTHPAEAEEILRHAHEWRAQFQDRRRERLVSLLTLDRYFRMTAQQV